MSLGQEQLRRILREMPREELIALSDWIAAFTDMEEGPVDTTESFVIAYGDPFNGLAFFGPYPSRESAESAAENSDGDWWVVEVFAP